MSSEATVTSLSRRYEIGAPSARSLLLTVLGEFLLPGEQRGAWTAAFIDTLALLGVEEKAARQALARTAADGWIESVKHGRRAAWELTPSGRSLLTAGAQRIYSFGAEAADWDGRWLLLLASVPESDRQRRHLLRSRLGWAGLGSAAPGLWISPYPQRQDEVATILAAAGVAGSASSFVAVDGAIGAPVQMVGQAWDLASIATRYDDFIATFAELRAADGDAALRRQIELVHVWRRFPLIDPALPPALLPTGWPGVRAAALFAQLHEGWAAPAYRRWQELTAG